MERGSGTMSCRDQEEPGECLSSLGRWMDAHTAIRWKEEGGGHRLEPLPQCWPRLCIGACGPVCMRTHVWLATCPQQQASTQAELGRDLLREEGLQWASS